MKLAIHNGKDKAVSWNTDWMSLCNEKNIDFIGVNCYSPSIISILKKENITHLMWAFSLQFSKDDLIARSVLNSAEKMGVKVFPNFNTSWHFEDKLAQKYWLESIDAPVVNSWVFFDVASTTTFLNKTQYPLVAKLRKGAGSSNVKLLKNKTQALKYANLMFNKGINPRPSITKLGKKKFKSMSKGKPTNLNFKDLIKKAKRHFFYSKTFQNEIGYVYFQEFLPNNENDLRVAVVGDKAWGFFRTVPKNDFRASGSGLIDYETEIPIEVIKESFEVTKRMGSQSIAFDYVKDPQGNYKIVEICYGYVGSAIYESNGYWTKDLNFIKGHFYPQEFILSNFINNANI